MATPPDLSSVCPRFLLLDRIRSTRPFRRPMSESAPEMHIRLALRETRSTVNSLKDSTFESLTEGLL